MYAAKRTDAGELRHGMTLAARGAKDMAAFRKISIRQRRYDGYAHDVFAGALDAIGRRARLNVIDVDHGRAAWLDVCGHPLLDRGVVLDTAVPVDMIFRDIEQNAYGRLE